MNCNRYLPDWTAPNLTCQHDPCIHQLFESQVNKSPDALALVFQDQQVTYGELNRRANQLAHYLRKSGVGTEVRVGLYLESSLDMVVGLLGILKAGGAYVPLDPSYPKERLAFMLEDANVTLLLSHQRLENKIPTPEGNVIWLDTGWETIALRERPESGSFIREREPRLRDVHIRLNRQT